MALFLNGKQVRGSLIVEGDLTMPLPTIDTASGSVASFDTDLTENLVDVKCQIVAKQASGTPSPDNPLPITTYTSATVSASGKNFFSYDNVYDGYWTSSSFVGTGEKINYGDSAWCFIKVPVTEGDKITISGMQARSGVYSAFIGSTVNDVIERVVNYNQNGTKTVPTGAKWYCLCIYVSGATNPKTDYPNAQVEIGSSASTYEPFGTTKNIPFGQTVAKGVLDVTTGKLTDEVLKIDKTDFPSMNVTFNSEVGMIRSFYLSLPLNTRKVDGFVLSNKFASQPLSGSHAYDCEVATSGGIYTVQRIYFSISNVDYPSITAEQAKQFLIDNDVEFYVTRYSNVVTQLDSITLQSLLNENNVWCDTGDTEVKYILTVGKKIA